MKPSWFVMILCVFSFTTVAQVNKDTTLVPDNKKLMVVEAACGQCQFELSGESCDLAVRINGKAYYVDGTTIDSHGDAHAADGFCNAIRKANVQGDVVNGRFKSTYFQLVAEKPKDKKAQ